MSHHVFRFTIRRFMISIAIFACVLTVGLTFHKLRRLRSEYRNLATKHAVDEANLRTWLKITSIITPSMSELLTTNLKVPSPSQEFAKRFEAYLEKSDAEAMKRMAENINSQIDDLQLLSIGHFKALEAAQIQIKYHVRMRQKYAEAAERPWIPVSPDEKDPGYTSLTLNALCSAGLSVKKDSFPPPLTKRPYSPRAGAKGPNPPPKGRNTPPKTDKPSLHPRIRQYPVFSHVRPCLPIKSVPRFAES